MRRSRWTGLLWGVVALVALLSLLKAFVADVYRVDSGSMRPTLFGGRVRPDAEEDAEHVLVRYDRDFVPQRFDLVVIRAKDGGKPLVKRVGGVPGDQDLVIRDGDLFVNHARLPAEIPRPEPIPVYDDRYQESEPFFEYLRDGSVRRAGDEWFVEGRELSPGSMLLFHPALRDDYLDRHHRRVPGVIEVNDAVLELEFALPAPRAAQKLHFQLVEEGDTFEVTLTVLDAQHGMLRLARTNSLILQGRREPHASAPPDIELGRANVALESGRFYRLWFANVDNHLHLCVPELVVDLAASYDENEPWPAPLPAGQKSLGSRVRFGAEAGPARFRGVRVLRDLYYTEAGRFGLPPETDPRRANGPARAPVSLGPDDYFLLGDNSAASTDSRHQGLFKAADLIGRPLAVVWPDPHWLRAVVDP
ncbi:MAG: hypothetical protein EXS08_05205 [Planctomycetes bacterium]|nr:hypothetical protein [Planctomycetota bacterium]